MRRHLAFDCEGTALAATIDEGDNTTGLLIVTGGNEIRSGAAAGQATLAAWAAAEGYPVFRYDRRGVADSEGENGGYLTSGPDIAAATAAFRQEVRHLSRIVALGNCDAASALMLFGEDAGLDALLLANPWTFDSATTDLPPPTAIRARYLGRLARPRTFVADLFAGRIDLAKLARGVRGALVSPPQSSLVADLAAAALNCALPLRILIARGDMTGKAFLNYWQEPAFAGVKKRHTVTIAEHPTTSHGFADHDAQNWLRTEIIAALATA